MPLDVKLIKQIKKLETPNNLKNNSDILERGVHAIICTGARGSGKTFLMTRFIPAALHESFFVYIIAKNMEQDCWLSLKKHYERLKIKVYESNTLSNEILAFLCEERKPKLVICDDITQSETKIYKNNLTTLFQIGRHYYINTVAITQNIIDIPNTMRRNATCYFAFKISSNPRTLIDFFSDFTDRTTLENAYKFIKSTENIHSCLYFQQSGENYVITKDFDLIPMENFASLPEEKKKKEKLD